MDAGDHHIIVQTVVLKTETSVIVPLCCCDFASEMIKRSFDFDCNMLPVSLTF